MKFYVDMLNPHSVHRLIDAVYEPHYQRYASYFGNTFAGFFSDEPRFSNGRYGLVYSGNEYEYTLGRFGVAYPWSEEVFNRLGVSPKELLALWFDIGATTSDIRIRYMELITDLYAQNFNSQLARWCHEHGVLYHGHIIEDMGTHARLGCSSGHYFKSMRDADLASVDVVLHQIKPFERSYPHYAPISGGYADPLFFDYTLAKLASSDAHLDPAKKGRACCEIFGAYGWAESTSEMLYLVNHMLVRGINHFIPHAFYHRMGLEDCPPHFYAGMVTQTDGTTAAMFRYMDRMCELFSGGTSTAETAVLYHAQAEWSGKRYLPVDRVAKYLMDSQQDFDIVDFDALSKATVNRSFFEIGNCRYRKLFVPEYEYLPAEYEKLLSRFSDFTTVFDEKSTPSRGMEGLRVYRYRKDDESYEMLFNESNRSVDRLNQHGLRYAIDYLRGTYRTAGEHIMLSPGEAVVLRNTPDGTLCLDGICETKAQERFDISVMELGKDRFTEYRKNADTDFDINAPDNLPDFSGWVRYEFEADIGSYSGMKVEYRGDACLVSISGKQYVGADRFVYCMFDKSMKKGGKAKIEITLRNSVAYRIRDKFSQYGYIGACMLDRVSFFTVGT